MSKGCPSSPPKCFLYLGSMKPFSVLVSQDPYRVWGNHLETNPIWDLLKRTAIWNFISNFPTSSGNKFFPLTLLGTQHVPYQGTFESMVFLFPVWWDMWFWWLRVILPTKKPNTLILVLQKRLPMSSPPPKNNTGLPVVGGFNPLWKICSSNWIISPGIEMNIKKIHPGRLTWDIIMEVWKIIFLSKWVICRFHVNLPGCMSSEKTQEHAPEATGHPGRPTHPHRPTKLEASRLHDAELPATVMGIPQGITVAKPNKLAKRPNLGKNSNQDVWNIIYYI